MKIISNNSYSEYEVKKSKFITYLYKIKDTCEITKIINELKNKYNDATHICYAYKIDDKIKFFDDGEPGGTAGLPIMEIINKNDINYILAVVIRYFGGTKLGAGGLIRAYQKGIKDALNNIKLNELIDGKLIEVIIKYEHIKEFEYLIKNINIINKEFLSDIKYTLEVTDDDLNLLNNYNYKILSNIKIEKNSC